MGCLSLSNNSVQQSANHQPGSRKKPPTNQAGKRAVSSIKTSDKQPSKQQLQPVGSTTSRNTITQKQNHTNTNTKQGQQKDKQQQVNRLSRLNYQSPVQSKKGQYQVLPIDGKQLKWDRSMPYAQFYQIQSSTNTLKYKASEFNRLQITTTNCFQREGLHIIDVKIVKQQPERAICIGFISSKRKEQESSGDVGDEESIGYWTYPNGECEIDNDGVAEKIGDLKLGCAVGGTVKITLDMKRDIIIIKRRQNDKQKKPAETSIKLPDSLRKGKLFAFVSMIQKGDQIQIGYKYSEK